MILARVVLRPVRRQYCPQLFCNRFQPISLQKSFISTEHFNRTATRNSEREWDDLISFWFDRNSKEWFMPSPGLDDEIRTRYQDLIAQARAGNLNHWTQTPSGVLCLVLLLDQFPRNIFRGSGESFTSDVQAQKLVTRAISQQFDRKIGKTSAYQQMFFYMPLMHAEDLLSQVACVALMENLVASAKDDPEKDEVLQDGLTAAKRHLDCVALLGRFPKRNEAIGRPHTEEEKEFLKRNPAGF